MFSQLSFTSKTELSKHYKTPLRDCDPAILDGNVDHPCSRPRRPSWSAQLQLVAELEREQALQSVRAARLAFV